MVMRMNPAMPMSAAELGSGMATVNSSTEKPLFEAVSAVAMIRMAVPCETVKLYSVSPVPEIDPWEVKAEPSCTSPASEAPQEEMFKLVKVTSWSKVI